MCFVEAVYKVILICSTKQRLVSLFLFVNYIFILALICLIAVVAVMAK